MGRRATTPPLPPGPRCRRKRPISRPGPPLRRHRSEEVDPFGLDVAYEGHVQPLLNTLFRDYFRVQVKGMEHLPEHESYNFV